MNYDDWKMIDEAAEAHAYEVDMTDRYAEDCQKNQHEEDEDGEILLCNRFDADCF